jgi:hypothetical protein
VDTHDPGKIRGLEMNNLVPRSIDSRFRLVKMALLAATFLLLALFVVGYVLRERFIYFWDYAIYHDFYANLGTTFAESPAHALHLVASSIRESAYNLLPTMFQMPFRFAFGAGRLPYILSITVTFVFPAIVIFSFVVSKLRGGTVAHAVFDDATLTLISALTLAVMPQLWVPVLLGSVDAGGLIIIFTVLFLYSRLDWAKYNFRSVAATALFLCLLIMYRRWYAYWVVGFFGSIVLCEIFRCAWDKQRRSHFAYIAENVLAMGLVSFSTFFIIATPIAYKMLTTNYRDAYSAYRSSHPLIHNLGALYDHFGLLTIVLAALGILLSLMQKERRPISYFLCVQFAITFVLFTRTQDFSIGENFGVQHYYWALATIAIFLSFFAQDAFLWAKTRSRKSAILVALLTVSVANFAVAFVPKADGLLKPVGFALTRLRQYPMVRTDLDQVRALLNSLDEVSNASDSTIYVLASSFSLNSSIARHACFSLQPPHLALASKIDVTNDVDKRDGFPIQMLRARYVVVTIPYGYHLLPQDQRVIGILADQLVNGEGIGASYDRMDLEYKLEDGSSVFIYRKVRPLDPSALRALSDTFLGFYSNYRDKFEISPNLIRELSAP